MQFKSTKHYLGKLVRDGHKWQYTDINGKEKKPKFYFSKLQYVLLIISLIAAYMLKNGFNNDFINYIISALSIFVGLFLTLMVLVFDKFIALNLSEIKKKIIDDKGSISEIEMGILLQKKNFFIQFTALTAYSIVISIICIVLLSIFLLSNSLAQDYSEYQFVGWKEISPQNIVFFFKLVATYFYKFITVYFLLDFLLIVLYSVSGIYTYFSIEYQRIKLTDDNE